MIKRKRYHKSKIFCHLRVLQRTIKHSRLDRCFITLLKSLVLFFRENVQIFLQGCTLPSKLTKASIQWSFVGQSGTTGYMKTWPTFKNISIQSKKNPSKVKRVCGWTRNTVYNLCSKTQ